MGYMVNLNLYMNREVKDMRKEIRTNKKQIEEERNEGKNVIEETLQDSSFDIELEYEVPPEEPYDKNRINTDHL